MPDMPTPAPLWLTVKQAAQLLQLSEDVVYPLPRWPWPWPPWKAAGMMGIGVGIFGNLGAIDIDHCLDDNGALSDMAEDIAATMGAYTEFSPSGKGLRILFTVPAGFQYDKARYYINNPKLGLEVYIAGATQKYVTVTGNTFTPGLDLEKRGEQLRAVLEK